jgi:hypothetical protein
VQHIKIGPGRDYAILVYQETHPYESCPRFVFRPGLRVFLGCGTIEGYLTTQTYVGKPAVFVGRRAFV